MAEASEAVTTPAVRLVPRAIDAMSLDAPPQPLTMLLGRERAAAAVLRQLNHPVVRLLTLTGPGGIGKTRLAIEVANEAGSSFPDGVAFVALAPLTDPAQVLPTTAQAIGLLGPGTLSIQERLARALDRQQLLIVLDNFEHVLPAATQLAELLKATRDVTFLVTSRSTLHISGEHEFAVPPLELPSELSHAPADLAGYSACALFEERTRAVRGEFAIDATNAATVLEICRRLGGVPLAIELAAARGKVLPPAALLDRLPHDLDLLSGGPIDHPQRHQTMRAAIQWSYDLLSSEQQRLFRALSIFAGGSTLEAAAAVAGPDFDGTLFDDICTLIDASLMRQEPGPDGTPRYWMLDLIRRFGIDQLAAHGEMQETVGRFAGWARALAEQAGAAFVGDGPGRWPQTLEREMLNFRAVLKALEDLGDVEALLDLTTALSPIWSALGHQREGLAWLTSGLDTANATTPAPLILSAQILATRLATTVGDFTLAMKLAANADALARQVGTRAAQADAACTLGNLARGLGDQATARAHYEDALAVYREEGDRYNIGYTLIQLGKLGDLGTPLHPGNLEDIEIADVRCSEAIEIYRALGNRWGMARALNHRAYVAYKAGRYRDAAEWAGEALPLFAEGGNLTEGSQCIENLADIAGVTGNGVLSAQLYGMAERLQERLGAPMWPTYRTEYEEEVARVRVLLDPAALDAAWRSGKELADDAMVEQALAVAALLSEARDAPLAETTETYGLTSRELDVLRLLATGASNREIADALFISVTTVKGHVQSIMRKLDLSSRTALAAFAVREQLSKRE